MIKKMDNAAKGREHCCYDEPVFLELTPAVLAMIEEERQT